MNKIKNQSGFAHIMILTIILAVAVIGLVGFVFWQNFMQPKAKSIDQSRVSSTNVKGTTSKDNTNDDPSMVALAKEAYDSTGGSGLAINYPSAWGLVHTGVESKEGAPDTNIITSPNGGVKIKMFTNMSGVGGTCGDPEDTTVMKTDRYQIQKYAGYTAYASIIKGNESKYYYKVDVIKDNATAQSVNVGDSLCGLGIGLFTDRNGLPASLSMELVGVQNGSSDKMSDITSIMNTDEYKIGVRILQSLHLK